MQNLTNFNTGKIINQGLHGSFHAMNELIKVLEMNFFLANRMVDGGIVPAVNSCLNLERDITGSLFSVLSGEKDLAEAAENLKNKAASGLKYEKLVKELGKELFASAKYEGEELLSVNEFIKLTYIPPKKGTVRQKKALFHVGGFLPYSDGVFRLLPEVNFFDRFLERGMPVYAMELKGDKEHMGDYRHFTLSYFIDMIEEMSNTAFEHNGQEKMAIEGYCGLAMPMLSYLCAQSESADRKFSTAFTMVAPIDASKCRTLADMLTSMPQNLLLLQFTLSELTGGYVRGINLRSGMDIPIRGFYGKSKLGRFMNGWNNEEFAAVDHVDDLSPAQRKELAGAYWISPENCDRYPMPVDLVKFSSSLFLKGIGEDGEIPYRYKGEKLSFKNLRDKTSIELIGFYGAKDNLVPHDTGLVLKQIFKDRYQHVVHESAGHISYVLSPDIWNKSHKKALNPNPVDLILK